MATNLNTTNLSRRAALTGAMAALSTVPAIAAAATGPLHPDAELLAVCRQWSEINGRYLAAMDHAASVPLLTHDSQIGANLRVCGDEEDRADFDRRGRS